MSRRKHIYTHVYIDTPTKRKSLFSTNTTCRTERRQIYAFMDYYLLNKKRNLTIGTLLL